MISFADIDCCIIFIEAPKSLGKSGLCIPFVEFLCDGIVNLDSKSSIAFALPLAVEIGNLEEGFIIALVGAADILYCVEVCIFNT